MSQEIEDWRQQSDMLRLKHLIATGERELRQKALDAALNASGPTITAADLVAAAKVIEAYLRGEKV